MAPIRARKRPSDQITSPLNGDNRTPIRKKKMALTAAQKQALIDNLQLELTERARRLRAQYNVQAQQLRSRVEMRVNRIPTALRKLKMGELLAKHSESQIQRPPRSPYVAKPPPVPAKDGTSPKPIQRKPISAASPRRGHKRMSDDVIDDKENSVDIVNNPKKKSRHEAAGAGAMAHRIQPDQILSPTSTNARMPQRTIERPGSPPKTERPFSPSKSMIARPASPSKSLAAKSSSNLLSSMVEKAKASRGGTYSRKAAASTMSASSSSTGTTGRSRKPTAATTTSARGRKRISQASESSEASTGTVVKKTSGSKTATTKAVPASKRTVMGTLKSATTKKAPAAKAATGGTTTAGRTLRKRA
ncbi:Borealin N terminal-domain-containing protein [Xylariales sp. PMI_506]|nr:Borealin N terminal-domain-containing protein [Xylariales sp. PMI_506]